MSDLKLQHLDKIYDNKVQAVFDFNLDVKNGELIVLVGPSGCGKSTTLRMVAGLEDISAGNLIIDGKDVTQMAPKDRDIAMVFQNYALYGHMTIYENMAFSLMLRKENKNEIHQKVLSAAEILGLTDQLNKKPNQLSGGQRKRLALAREIMREPDLIMLDEPTNHLDIEIIEWLENYLRRSRMAILMVTHDRYFLDRAVNYIWDLENNKITRYRGNYTKFKDLKNAKIEYESKEYERQQLKMKAMR